MFRAVVAGVVVLAIGAALAGCSSGATGVSGGSAACSLLTQLGATGETVARADVSDPVAFDRALHGAVTKYVQVARKLRDAVPAGLRPDVDRMIVAAQRRRFADADTARARIDDYARSACGSDGTTQ